VGQVAVDAAALGAGIVEASGRKLASGHNAQTTGETRMNQSAEDGPRPAKPLGEDGVLRTAKPCGPGARRRRQAVGEAQAETAATESTKNSSPGRSRH